MSEFTETMAYTVWDLLHGLSVLLTLLSPLLAVVVVAVLVVKRRREGE